MSRVAREFARMVDLSAVQAENTKEDVLTVAKFAREHDVIAVHVLPCWVPLLKEELKGSNSMVGAPIGFPGGAHVSDIKVAEVRRLIEDGAQEVDMVMNISKALSGDFDGVAQDIRAVMQAASPTPGKVILECYHLDEATIRKCCDLIVENGAAWVKTATGWKPTGATREGVAIIADQVKGRVGIKAAGGVRTLDDVRSFYNLGVRRFGMSLSSTQKIYEQLTKDPSLFPELEV